MHEKFKEKTTFIYIYIYIRKVSLEFMPFELKNSGETFQRMMDYILVSLRNAKCFIDDLVIHSATAES